MNPEKKFTKGRDVILSESYEDRTVFDEYYLLGYKTFLQENFPERLDEYEKLINSVDFGLLQKIFYEELKKSEINPQTFNLLSKDNLQLVPQNFICKPEDNVSAAYDALKNKILIPVKPNVPEVSVFVHGLIHELTHGYSHTSTQFISKDKVFLKSGLKSATQNFETQTHHELFEGLNEGVTERIAQEICLEYAKQIGDTELLKGLEDFVTEYDSGENPHRYEAYMSFVDEIVRRVSVYADLPTDVVWNAITKHYFNGEPVFFSSLEEFATIFGEDFVKELSQVGNKTKINDVFEFAGRHEMPEPKKGWQDGWLQYLGIDISTAEKEDSTKL